MQITKIMLFIKIRNENGEKEKYKVVRKEKKGGKTNKEKLKNKPYMMVKYKRLRDIEVKKVKLNSMKKQMKIMKKKKKVRIQKKKYLNQL